jgi:hypothetical protein
MDTSSLETMESEKGEHEFLLGDLTAPASESSRAVQFGAGGVGGCGHILFLPHQLYP